MAHMTPAERQAAGISQVRGYAYVTLADVSEWAATLNPKQLMDMRVNLYAVIADFVPAWHTTGTGARGHTFGGAR